MSFDLFIWDPPGDASDDDVRDRCHSAGESTGEPDQNDPDLAAGESERVTLFMEALMKRYPRMEDTAGDALRRSPWSCSPERGNRWVQLTIRWGDVGSIAIPVIERLVREYGLVLYDPQGDDVHRPG